MHAASGVQDMGKFITGANTLDDAAVKAIFASVDCMTLAVCGESAVVIDSTQPKTFTYSVMRLSGTNQLERAAGTILVRDVNNVFHHSVAAVLGGGLTGTPRTGRAVSSLTGSTGKWSSYNAVVENERGSRLLPQRGVPPI